MEFHRVMYFMFSQKRESNEKNGIFLFTLYGQKREGEVFMSLIFYNKFTLNNSFVPNIGEKKSKHKFNSKVEY